MDQEDSPWFEEFVGQCKKDMGMANILKYLITRAKRVNTNNEPYLNELVKNLIHTLDRYNARYDNDGDF